MPSLEWDADDISVVKRGGVSVAIETINTGLQSTADLKLDSKGTNADSVISCMLLRDGASAEVDRQFSLTELNVNLQAAILTAAASSTNTANDSGASNVLKYACAAAEFGVNSNLFFMVGAVFAEAGTVYRVYSTSVSPFQIRIFGHGTVILTVPVKAVA